MRIDACGRAIALAIILSVSASATSTFASIFLTSSNQTSLPNGLVSYTISAQSTGETIVGIGDPSITPISGLGPHQVWIPPINGQTPTRSSQNNFNPLWSDNWLPYDTYFFFTDSQTISAGPGQIQETESTPGVSLGAGPFGAPPTGYGPVTTVGGSLGYQFTPASGLQGTTVPLMQVVSRFQDREQVSMTVFAADGTTTQASFTTGGCICGIDVFPHEINNVNSSSPGFVNYFWDRVADLPSSLPLPTWSDFKFDSYQPPVGLPSTTIPATPATFTDGGFFQWNTLGAPVGTYVWEATFSGQGFSDTGTLIIHVTAVPENATASLLAIGLVALLAAPMRKPRTV